MPSVSGDYVGIILSMEYAAGSRYSTSCDSGDSHNHVDVRRPSKDWCGQSSRVEWVMSVDVAARSTTNL